MPSIVGQIIDGATSADRRERAEPDIHDSGGFGCVRDVDEIRRIGFPAWARVFRPNAGDPKGYGEIGTEIECGDQRVRTGDWVVADDNGVVVIPKDKVQEMANRAVDVKEQEDRLRAEIERGSSLSKVLKLKKWEKVVG